VVVPFGAGGGADRVARKLTQLVEPFLGVPLFVSNIPGASGNAGLTKLLANPPDGYTVATLTSFTVAAWASGIGYARPDDFLVLTIPQQSPSMLFVPADSPFKTFNEMLSFAKANPGRLKVATSGYGSNDDVTLKFFTARGFPMANVPYAKPEQRYASPFGKRTHAVYEEPGDVAHLLAKKQLRPLVVFDAQRHPAFADVPPAKELGFEMPELPNFRMLVVQAATPRERVSTLVRAVERALDTPEWKKFCAETYSCTRKYTPQQATQRMQAFFETIQKYLRQVPPERN
jgi:tripartite-type tricarboxylate transporter receptor subunit TctC